MSCLRICCRGTGRRNLSDLRGRWGCGHRGNLKVATEHSDPAFKLSCYHDIVLSRCLCIFIAVGFTQVRWTQSCALIDVAVVEGKVCRPDMASHKKSGCLSNRNPVRSVRRRAPCVYFCANATYCTKRGPLIIVMFPSCAACHIGSSRVRYGSTLSMLYMRLLASI